METGNAMEFHFTFTIEIRFFEMVGKIILRQNVYYWVVVGIFCEYSVSR
jgi:hypothetical protein